MKLAIIIPCYNCEKYIKKCINSILGQTFHDFIIFLVDDGSTDCSSKIIESLSDYRIRYYRQDNAGVSSARNFAMQVVFDSQEKFDYLMFIDADDWLEDNALAQIFNNPNNLNVDYILFNWNEYHFKNNEIIIIPHKINNKFNQSVTIEDIKRHFLKTRTGGSPWGKVYRVDIVKNNNIVFDTNLPYAEDYLFNLEYIKYSRSCRYINKYLYGYNCLFGGARVKTRKDLIDLTIHIEQKKFEMYRDVMKYRKYLDDELIERTAIGIRNLKSLDMKNNEKKKEIKKAIAFLKDQNIGSYNILFSQIGVLSKLICLLFYYTSSKF